MARIGLHEQHLYSDADPIDSADFKWRLFLGQAIDILGKMPDDHFDCIWTDPPYLLSNGGITCHAGKMVSVNKGDWDKSRGWEQDLELTEEWMTECHRVLKPTGTIWVSGTLHFHPIAGMALIKSGFRLLNDIIWEKPNPPPNLGCRTFTHSTELVYWAAKARKGDRPNYVFNYSDMKAENGGKQMKTVWQFKAPGRDEKLFGKHPTQKPVALIERCIRASTSPNDLILDPFVGVASTGVAAVKTGRRFVGIEVEEEYLDIGLKRLTACTPPPRYFGRRISTAGPRFSIVFAVGRWRGLMDGSRRCHRAAARVGRSRPDRSRARTRCHTPEKREDKQRMGWSGSRTLFGVTYQFFEESEFRDVGTQTCVT